MDKIESWLRPGRFTAFLAALVIAQFPAVIFGLATFFFRDYGYFGFPLAAYHRDAFWSGEIPLWNPYNNAGLPFLAQWNTMVLYPGSLIYLLLPLPWSLNLFCLSHQFFAGLGMYFLARRTAGSNLSGAIAAIAYAFGGLLLSSLKWPNNIAAFGLMPWVVLTVLHSRSFGIAALVGALQMLTGAPEVIFLTWSIIGVLTLGEAIAARRVQPVLRLALAVVLVTAISAAQLLPFLQLLSQSQRSSEFGASSEWSMPIWGWANFFVPLFGTFPSYHGVPAQPQQYWTSTYYVPLGALALALLAALRGWRERLIAALALLGMILALGDAGKLYGAMRSTVPSLGFMRFPIKFVVLPIFLFPWLAAHGVSVLRERKKTALTIAAIFAAICLTLIFVPSPFTPAQPQATLNANAILRIFFLGIFILLLFNPTRFGVLPILPLVILWLDARFHAPEQNPSAPRWVFDRGVSQFTNAPTLGHGRAMLDAFSTYKMDHLMFDNAQDEITAGRLALYSNANLIDRIPKIDGFYSLYPRESAQLINYIYANTNLAFPGLEKLLAVSHKNLPGKTIDWQQVASNPPWISGGQKTIRTNDTETIKAILAPDFDPSQTLYLTPESANSPPPSKVEIQNVTWTPEKIHFTASAQTNAWLLIAQSYSKNWKAKLNNADVPIHRANHGFQAIHLPNAGQSDITLLYTDTRFTTGLLISFLGLATTAVLIFLRK